ncbi:MAG: hypothetical protein MK033_04565 [Candidatus Caenarcaniphilales bacterium]|nr:hypothetical protein [Candidatus Caenarcaniphilales bacterium]
MIFDFANLDDQLESSLLFLIGISPVFYVVSRIDKAAHNDINEMKIKAGEEPLPKWRWWFMIRPPRELYK